MKSFRLPIENSPAQAGFFKRRGEFIALATVLALAAFMRFFELDKNGTGNAYYAAAVRSMLMSWHNFFYVSFDPAGIVTVDKPPVALWVQALSSKLLGFSGVSLMVPQAIEGCLGVLILYHLVRRRFGASAALLASLALALEPLSVAVDRFNNVDACLVFVLLLAAWAISLAAESGRRRYLFLAMALVGIGFNTKMMAAFVVLPAFYLLYAVGAPKSWNRRAIDLAMAGVVLAVVALSWPLAVDLTPPEQRPFVGSTQDNSMVSLSLGWNGFQRLTRRGRGGAWARGNRRGAGEFNASRRPKQTSGVSGPNGRKGVPGMGTGTPGPLRLAQGSMATQISWFFPLVLIGLLAASRSYRQGWPLSPKHQALLLWTGWLLVYGVVFSFMGGAMHTYYLVVMTPPLCALFGIGFSALVKNFQQRSRMAWALPFGILLCGAWQVFLLGNAPDWKPLILPVLVTFLLTAVAPLVIVPMLEKKWGALERWLGPSLVLGLLALFMAPTLWALGPVLGPQGGGGSPEADIELISESQPHGRMGWGMGTESQSTRLLDFLKAHRQGEKYLLAAQNARSVQSIIINTGETAISMGGFMGGDPAVTLPMLIQMVQTKQLRYVLLQDREAMEQENPAGEQEAGEALQGGAGFGWGQGATGMEISNWVHQHGQEIDPALWRGPKALNSPPALGGSKDAPGAPAMLPGRGRMGALKLYDLRPDRGPSSQLPKHKRSWHAG